ncbi:hypothetical protein CRM22_008875 [Opisthorchis felineus]|uniref:Kazal-like domain-containing protein n=1 Tax=Opisthorchis felineus TaxID=147828 RepID=A0A4S2L996_OPIFE|nr:hypothetical protein CRM22_008875 [Opisthorchis felineus]
MMKYVVLFLGWLAYTYSTQFVTHGDTELEACIVNCSIHHEDGPIFADCGPRNPEINSRCPTSIHQSREYWVDRPRCGDILRL